MTIERDQLRRILLSGDIPPVIWTYWFSEAPEGDAKEALKAILFDDRDVLRDLTAPGVAENIANCVLAHPELIDVV